MSDIAFIPILVAIGFYGILVYTLGIGNSISLLLPISCCSFAVVLQIMIAIGILLLSKIFNGAFTTNDLVICLFVFSIVGFSYVLEYLNWINEE